MPPRKLSDLKSISINSSESRSRFNMTGDLVTRSQAALSSQGTIHTQRTQSTLGTQLGNIGDDFEFNRQQITQVQISKEQQHAIQQILQFSRKGKINQKNAFQIPIKVMQSSNSDSANTKFWKFASELLGASMSIYDKRVQNMYISTNTMQNKLIRINVNVKSKQDKEDDERDDAIQDQERRNNRQNAERLQMLSVSADDFGGTLDYSNDFTFANTLEVKDKISIKNIENKFIADPVFLKTQKMFDSYSLKSLMLNIFPTGRKGQILLFNQSNEDFKDVQKVSQTIIDQPKQKFQVKSEFTCKQQQQNDEGQQTKMTIFPSKGNQQLSFDFLKVIQVSGLLLQQASIFSQVQQFIKKQPELKFDYLERNRKNMTQGDNISYQKVVQDQRRLCQDLYNDVDANVDQQDGQHHYQQLVDNGGLTQIHSVPFHPQNQDDNDSFLRVDQNIKWQSQSQHMNANAYSMSNQEPFFGIDQKSHQVQPIMPWQIEFRNQKLMKKKNVKKRNMVQSNKQKKKDFQINFTLEIEDIEQVLKKPKNSGIQESLKFKDQNFRQNNIIAKQFEAEVQYNNFAIRQGKKSQNVVNKVDPRSMSNRDQNFFYDNMNNFVGQFGNNQSQGRMQVQNDDFLRQDNNFNPLDRQSMGFQNNTQMIGNRMGITNIRQIKKFVCNEVIENGCKTILQIQKVLPLSQAQIFTVFLHLVNQHNLNIETVCNQNGQEDVVLSKPKQINEDLQM